VDYFPNNAPLVVPGLNEDFRNMLIDKINSMTNLEQVKENGIWCFKAKLVITISNPWTNCQQTELKTGDNQNENRIYQ